MQLKSKNRPQRRNPLNVQAGVSLIELMVGITVALILMAGVISVFVNISASSSTAIKSARLNDELRMVSNLIVRGIQRAGYVNAWNTADQTFDLDYLSYYGLIGPTSGCNINTGTCNCVLYRYDENDDAVTDIGGAVTPANAAAADGEYFGFRLNNGVIQMKKSGADGDDACADGDWEGITSDDITFTTLTFAVDSGDSEEYEIDNDDGDGSCESGETCLDRRKVDIVISGRLTRDATVSMTIRSEVKLMNDRYYTKS